MTPEHAHLVLVHLPIVGLLAAAVPLAWGVLRTDRTATALGLALAALFALATPLVVASGDGAEDRLEHGQGPLALDPAGQRWLEVHEERAEAGAVVLYVAAGLLAASLGVLGKMRHPALPRGLGAGGLAVCALSFATLAWVAEAGGKIRHPELREGSSVASTPRADDDD